MYEFLVLCLINIQDIKFSGLVVSSFTCSGHTETRHRFFVFFTDVMGGAPVECSVNNSKYRRDFIVKVKHTDII